MRKLSHITILDEYAVDMDVVLGQGSTGCVYQGLNMKTSSKVAIKIIDLRTIDNEVARYLLNMEKNAIMSINNPNVLRGFKVTEDSRYCFIITEFCNGGTLKKYIRNSPEGYLSQQQSLQIIRQILHGYQSLVEKGIVHRDLKPANIMLHNDVPKIIDFGYCQIKGFIKPKLEYNVGSPSYMAPQSFQQNFYNQKTQIWAIGVILFQCVTGRTIDEGRHMSEVFREIDLTGVPYPSHVSYYVRNIINWCLSKNPKRRPTCLQLLETYFSPHHRSKSKFSPYKTELQCIRQTVFPTTYQRMSSFNQSILKQKSPDREKAMFYENDSFLVKSTRMEPKQKTYKVPEFLQANNKVKKDSHENKQNLIKPFNHFGESKEKECQIKASKSSKIYEERPHARTTAVWQYGGHTQQKRNSQFIQPKKKLNIDQMYRKLCKQSNTLQKNRILSTNLSPGHQKILSPSKFLMSNPSKQTIRKKRTFTQRLKLVRA